MIGKLNEKSVVVKLSVGGINPNSDKFALSYQRVRIVISLLLSLKIHYVLLPLDHVLIKDCLVLVLVVVYQVLIKSMQIEFSTFLWL